MPQVRGSIRGLSKVQSTFCPPPMSISRASPWATPLAGTHKQRHQDWHVCPYCAKPTRRQRNDYVQIRKYTQKINICGVRVYLHIHSALRYGGSRRTGDACRNAPCNSDRQSLQKHLKLLTLGCPATLPAGEGENHEGPLLQAGHPRVLVPITTFVCIFKWSSFSFAFRRLWMSQLLGRLWWAQRASRGVYTVSHAV